MLRDKLCEINIGSKTRLFISFFTFLLSAKDVGWTSHSLQKKCKAKYLKSSFN